jgi:hypothetical protein
MIALLLFTLLAKDPPDIAARETVAVLAGAMAENNAEKFLAQLSPELQLRLSKDIRALLLQHDITSSISPSSNEGDDRKRVLELDWYLEIRAQSGELALVRRRENIRCTVELNAKKKWRITAIEPASFFAPPSS